MLNNWNALCSTDAQLVKRERLDLWTDLKTSSWCYTPHSRTNQWACLFRQLPSSAFPCLCHGGGNEIQMCRTTGNPLQQNAKSCWFLANVWKNEAPSDSSSERASPVVLLSHVLHCRFHAMCKKELSPLPFHYRNHLIVGLVSHNVINKVQASTWSAWRQKSHKHVNR